jgi:hypothetical protein
MTKLRQSLERLKCDIQVLCLSKKLNKETGDESLGCNEENGVENSTDSDKIISE